MVTDPCGCGCRIHKAVIEVDCDNRVLCVAVQFYAHPRCRFRRMYPPRRNKVLKGASPDIGAMSAAGLSLPFPSARSRRSGRPVLMRAAARSGRKAANRPKAAIGLELSAMAVTDPELSSKDTADPPY